MKTYKLKTSYKKLLSDTTTPVSIYLRLRDVFPNSILLESSDYYNRENSMSYVCCSPIAGIKLDDKELQISYPDGESITKSKDEIDLRDEVAKFRECFEDSFSEEFKFISNGLFGYLTFDTIEHFEDIKLTTPLDPERNIPFCNTIFTSLLLLSIILK